MHKHLVILIDTREVREALAASRVSVSQTLLSRYFFKFLLADTYT